MQLSYALSGKLPAPLRERGRVLFAKGAVFIQSASSAAVAARVVGGSLYAVELQIDPETEELEGICDCPYYLGGAGFCKHLWATLLAAEAAGYLAPGGNGAQAPGPQSGLRPVFGQPAKRPHQPALWEAALHRIAAEQASATQSRWSSARPISYTVLAAPTRESGRLTLDIAYRDLRKDGSPGKPKGLSIGADLIAGLPESADRQALSMIAGTADTWRGYYSGYGKVWGMGLQVPDAIVDLLVPAICRTGRAEIELLPGEPPVPLRLDEGPPWELCLKVDAASDDEPYRLRGVLRREGAEMDLSEPVLLLAGGFVFSRDAVVARLQDFNSFAWVGVLRRNSELEIARSRGDEFLSEVLGLGDRPRLELPADLGYEQVEGAPGPRLRVTANHERWSRNASLRAELSFDYQGREVDHNHPATGIFLSNPRRMLVRDIGAEQQAAVRLEDLGLRQAASGDHFLLPPRRLPAAARALVADGWWVEAEGSLYRTGGAAQMRIRSEVDWFELEGSVDFAGEAAELPELLAAIKRGEDFVRLGDGSIGLVPEAWLAQYKAIAGIGTAVSGGLRFQRSQVGLIDALLASRPEVGFDETFKQARQRLLEFDAVEPAPEPEGFTGELRPYQREGLGWLYFLSKMGFGGCLADDMGLGKTVQVLALLQSRTRLDDQMTGSKPSLVVVPKSLVFNWLQEAARFAPELRILDHTGSRELPGSHFDDYHLVVTTYGTLRRDIAHLAEVEFDYCILDEAQAIKNPGTGVSKASRLIRADHRLALSGTPIENHLGELWSLFDFLNPGMLGSVSAFQKGMNTLEPDEPTRRALAQALRPFILRRTKQQVAKDLPPKTEQTQYCELSAGQRRHYDQLKNHYRKSLMARVDRDGMAQSKMFVLEALLRLRQAACHPGLVDPKRVGEPSAKLELLLPQLREVVDEGHKALVFSQFTSFLSILRDRLDAEGIRYEYLDGKTRDRQQRVEHFQNDPDCRLFLISLKAGGLGLNLTAAEYVFLLDPWWNPAVEAQAIDRAHRIGQQRPVLAYRIIARNTVEEKVLQLQQSKRELADAIITADNSLIRQIRREDLELLLS